VDDVAKHHLLDLVGRNARALDRHARDSRPELGWRDVTQAAAERADRGPGRRSDHKASHKLRFAIATPTIARTAYRVLLPPCTPAPEPLKRLANPRSCASLLARSSTRVDGRELDLGARAPHAVGAQLGLVRLSSVLYESTKDSARRVVKPVSDAADAGTVD
jgi:hypothetical protein